MAEHLCVVWVQRGGSIYRCDADAAKGEWFRIGILIYVLELQPRVPTAERICK